MAVTGEVGECSTLICVRTCQEEGPIFTDFGLQSSFCIGCHDSGTAVIAKENSLQY